VLVKEVDAVFTEATSQLHTRSSCHTVNPHSQLVTSHKSADSQTVTELVMLCYHLVSFGNQLCAKPSRI